MSARIPLDPAWRSLPVWLSRAVAQPLDRSVLCCLLAAACLVPASGLAAKKNKAPTTKTVTGQVQDPAEKTIGGAEVTLKDLQTGKTLAIYADENGQYQFTDLDPHHDFEIQAKFKGVASETRQVTSFDTRWKVVINLTIPPPSS
ncbi:MAG: carboxypeptidase-like regulatory domain-containing protein [Terriglobia bacterium]